MNDLTSDRRELWWIYNFLSVNATTDQQRKRARLLRKYLWDTCEHEFMDVGGYADCPAGTRQCSHCTRVTFPTDEDYEALTNPPT